MFVDASCRMSACGYADLLLHPPLVEEKSLSSLSCYIDGQDSHHQLKTSLECLEYTCVQDMTVPQHIDQKLARKVDDMPHDKNRLNTEKCSHF